MTYSARAVRRFDARERRVYQAAVDLTRARPHGFTASELADAVGCAEDVALEWLEWLRRTGDFEAIEPPPGRPGN
ncbi:MAG: hypothetical protein HYU66_09805 [Armatimonadetes bacterium]|nr:hypothetical protein [Armatimonadota bacterium]